MLRTALPTTSEPFLAVSPACREISTARWQFFEISEEEAAISPQAMAMVVDCDAPRSVASTMLADVRFNCSAEEATWIEFWLIPSTMVFMLSRKRLNDVAKEPDSSCRS